MNNSPACFSLKNQEDVTLIWLDQTIDTTRTTLREINDYVLLYTEIETCFQSIRSRSNERIYLIISLDYAKDYLEEIYHLAQIDAIFIFCLHTDREQIDEKFSKKIIGIFDDEDQLIQSIRKELEYFHHQSLDFAFYQTDSVDFHWFHLLKDLLHRLPRSDQSRDEMLKHCREYYHGNDEELKLIDQFSGISTSTSTAIHWYAKQSFLYRLCSKALRMENLSLIYLFRSYLQDLIEQLVDEQEKKTFFRGLRLSQDQLTKFQSNIGSYVIPKGFLFATRDYQHALQSILQTSKRSADLLSTIFLVEIDGHISASVNDNDVLLNLSSVFEIMDINCKDEIWLIHLRLTNQSFEIPGDSIESFDFEKFLPAAADDNDQFLSSYTNLARMSYCQGYLDRAYDHFQILARLQSEENHFDRIRILNYLALISFERKHYSSALDSHFHILQIHTNKQLLPDLLLAHSHHSIGMIFIEQREYEHAMKYLFYAMHLYEKHSSILDQSVLAMNLNNIGLVYFYLKDYTHALEYCSKSFEIREKIFPSSHAFLADSCNNLALIYHHLYEYDKALDLFERAVKIYENDHRYQMRIPICWNNIGLIYLDQHQYDRAIEYYFQALNTYLKTKNVEQYREEIEFTYDNLGVAFEMKGDEDNALNYYQKALENHSKNAEKFVRISTKIGNIFFKKGDYHQALIHYQNAYNQSEGSSFEFVSSLLMSMAIIHHRQQHYQLALEIYRRVLTIRKYLGSKNQLDLAWTYNNISCVYDDMGDVMQALNYQEKAHQIRRKSLPSTHPDLAVSLNNLGRIHQIIAHQSGGDPRALEQALQNYKSALHIRRKSLPMDHPDLAISYYNLALVHIDQEEYEQAFMEVQKALKIQRRKLSIDHPDLLQTLATPSAPIPAAGCRSCL